MPWVSLGRVTVAVPGTPVSAVTNVSPTAPQGSNQTVYSCLAILFQTVTSNAGKTYVGSSATFNKTTGVGLLAALGVPTANVIPSAGATIPNAPAALNAADYWIDADNGGEGVQVSALFA
jgi:hypothetical protein